MTYTFDSLLTESISLNMSDNHIVPALIGEAGIGKTAFINALAENMGVKAFVIQINQLAEKGDLVATKTLPDGNGSYSAYFFPHHIITECIDYANEHPDSIAILYLDEFNRADPDLTSAAMTLSTARTVGTTKLPDNVRIIASGNDRGAVNDLDSASTSRFVIYNVEPSADTFISIMGDTLHPIIKKVLLKNPEFILNYPESDNDEFSFEDVDTTPLRQFTCPRTLEGLNSWLAGAHDTFLQKCLNTADPHDTHSTMLQNIIVSHIGDTTAAQEIYALLIKDIQTKRPKTKRKTHNANQQTIIIDKPDSIDDIMKAALESHNTLNELLEKCGKNKGDEWLSTMLLYTLTTDTVSVHGIDEYAVHVILDNLFYYGATLSTKDRRDLIAYANIYGLPAYIAADLTQRMNSNIDNDNYTDESRDTMNFISANRELLM